MPQQTTAVAVSQSGEADDPQIVRELSPISAKDFGEEQARHLLWRAGFGGTLAQVRMLAEWGPERSVDALLAFGEGADGAQPFEPPRADQFDKDIMRPPTQEERQRYRRAQQAQDEDTLAELRRMRQEREGLDRRQIGQMQQWWLRRMIETPNPLEEKLTLFWHGHFATNYRTIENSYHMFLQNQLFRRHAAGNFGALLAGIVRDPAMLAYLDNNDSRRDQPNENLAREVMELFALGIGNYSERDIKEGARALTGYTFEDDQFVFNRRNHDSGTKTILGQTGGFDGDDFVRVILARRDCAHYIARRLYNCFVADVPPDERGGMSDLPTPQRAVLRELGEMLYARQYELRPLLRRLFLSRHFYSPAFVRQQIKSPTQLVVGAVRSLHVPVRDLGILNEALDLMGQRLLHPPSVKGWDGGRSWISTSTLFVRQNIMAYLIAGKKPQGFDPTADTQPYDAMRHVMASATGMAAQGDPHQVARHVLSVSMGYAPDALVASLTSYLQDRGNVIDNASITGCLLLATASPEYNLC